jgi:hypothetical protein
VSVADYAGRTYDVLAFRGAAARGEVRLDQSLFGTDAGTICTGIQKLAQRFVLELLTERGSLPYSPTRGTTFMTRLQQGWLRTEADVFVAFSFALNDLELNLMAEEAVTDPDDERFASASLDRVFIEPGVVVLHVTVWSRAGLARKVILPVATAI